MPSIAFLPTSCVEDPNKAIDGVTDEDANSKVLAAYDQLCKFDNGLIPSVWGFRLTVKKPGQK